MDNTRKVQLLNKRTRLRREIAELEKHRDEVAQGVSSATLSSGGGSKTYTNFSPETIQSVIDHKREELNRVVRTLRGQSTRSVRHVATVRI